MRFVESDVFEPSPGSKKYTSLRVGDLPNGYPVLMPVMAISGFEDGPTLLLTACLHGDEVLGSEVIRRTLNALSPSEMRGTLLGVPMSNPTAFATRTRRNIVEMYPGPEDMNRVFAEPQDGVMTERVARILRDRFILPADYAFDLHSASVGGLWQPYTVIPDKENCSSPEVHDESVALARAFGAPNLLAVSMFHGTLVDFAVRNGTPASMAEFGVANVIDDESRTFGMRGVANVLKHLGMIDGQAEALEEDQKVLRGLHRLRTDVGGYLLLRVVVGSEVSAGDLIASVEDLSGRTVSCVRAPSDGVVCRVSTMGVVGSGDIVAYVATL